LLTDRWGDTLLSELAKYQNAIEGKRNVPSNDA
jgi:hypothetical protein